MTWQFLAIPFLTRFINRPKQLTIVRVLKGTYGVRPLDEVMDTLRSLRDDLAINSGFMTGIGAVDCATLGHYDVDEQSYSEEMFTVQFEVTSYTSNIGPDKIHAHIELGRDSFDTFGGHCSEAQAFETFEIDISIGETALNHEIDEQTGLDVFDLR